MLGILISSILHVNVEGAITPITAEYIQRAYEEAESKGYDYVLITINTPGGLESAMRKIVERMLSSQVKTITFVYPQGARSASAGVFITLAGDKVAMAEGTNMGSASPVSLVGQMDSIMLKKVMNDVRAFLRSILKKRGKPEFWADSFVVHARSYSAYELRKFGLVDVIANDIESLLDSLGLPNMKVVPIEMTWREKFLKILTDPNVAYFLLLIGLYGIIFELASPGFGISGILGFISLILALFALQILSANIAGLLLILLAFIFFFVEVKMQTGGLFGIAGALSFIIGSIMLFSRTPDYFSFSLWSVIWATLITLLFFFVIVAFAVKAMRRKPTTGIEGMIGAEGEVIEDFVSGKGRVMVHGEIWWAESEYPLKKGESVIVESVKGLKLKVKPKL